MTSLGNIFYGLFVLTLPLVLWACSPDIIQHSPGVTPTLSQLPTLPTTTVTSQPTPHPSTTPTLPPTYTLTPRPSNTPTIVPTITPTATPDRCDVPGTIAMGSYTSQIAGQEMGYRIYLPPCYGEDGQNYPVLYMFHGNISGASQWDDLGIDEAADQLILAAEIPPLIIVLPDGGYIANNSSGGPFSFEGVILNELIPHVEANYCAWPSPAGRALGGLSRGAYWALEIAFRNAAEFASVGAHSAALVDTHAGPEFNPQFTGLTKELGDLRIFMDIGSEDWFINNFQRLHQDMEEAGRAHTWVLNEGRHEDSYWSEHVGEYLLWYASNWAKERGDYPPCETNLPDQNQQ